MGFVTIVISRQNALAEFRSVVNTSVDIQPLEGSSENQLHQKLLETISTYSWEQYERECEVEHVLYAEREMSQAICIVLTGTVALYRRHQQKNNLMISVCCDGDVLGLETLYGSDDYSCTAIVKKPSRVLVVPRAEFMRALDGDSKLLFAVLREYGSQSQMLDRRFVGVARMSSRARLCDLLLLIESRIGVDEQGNLNAVLRGRDLAELAASAEETIYRVVAKLEADELLRYNRGRVKLIDRKKLQRESSKFSS